MDMLVSPKWRSNTGHVMPVPAQIENGFVKARHYA